MINHAFYPIDLQKDISLLTGLLRMNDAAYVGVGNEYYAVGYLAEEQFHANAGLSQLKYQEKAAQGKSGFVPAGARWVIERSNAWMKRCKILVKNFERTLANATTKINLCFIRLMIKRLSATS